MKVILYTNHCPCCDTLESMLKSARIAYETFDNTEEMLQMGMTHMPMLSVDGNLMNFSVALVWLKGRMSAHEN